MFHRNGQDSQHTATNARAVSVASSFQNIVVDLGDVLFAWSPPTKLNVSSHDIRAILRSSTWFEYEKGKISQAECYAAAAAEFGLTSQDISTAFQAARASLQCDSRVVDLLRELKARGNYRLFVMSNISSPDYEVLRTKADNSTWSLFDGVFTSAAAGERKPNLGFFRHLISHTGIDSKRTIFIDDKLENVLTARSLGMYGIVFDDFAKVSQQLRSLCDDPVGRAHAYLNANRKQLISVTSGQELVQENFSQLLIFEAIGERRLVDLVVPPRLFNFFKGKGQFTTKEFPNDVDTTAIGLTVLSEIDHRVKHEVMDEILALRNQDGIVQVYFDPSRPRTDPVVCVNVLSLFYTNGRGADLDSTLDWCYDVLVYRAYMEGTLYYTGPEAFLFFLSRLMATSKHVRTKFGVIFSERLSERIGTEGDSLALAMRILAATVVGIRNDVDYQKLRSMQEPDGSWSPGWLYKYGSSGLLIGNRGLTTALALKAVQTFQGLGEVA